MAFLKVIVQVSHFLPKGRQTMPDVRVKASRGLSSCGSSWFCAVDNRLIIHIFQLQRRAQAGKAFVQGTQLVNAGSWVVSLQTLRLSHDNTQHRRRELC